VSSPLKRFDPSKARIPGTNLRGWRAIAAGALGLYILLFVILNNRRLEVHFVFFKVRSNELLALAVIAALSFAAGFIVAGRRARPGEPQPRSGADPEPPAPAD
jgi:uncharacterized integral membrane protein